MTTLLAGFSQTPGWKSKLVSTLEDGIVSHRVRLMEVLQANQPEFEILFFTLFFFC